MLSYAYRRGIQEVFLLYPNRLEGPQTPDTFRINSGFADHPIIRITAAEVPFWSSSGPDAASEALAARLRNLLMKVAFISESYDLLPAQTPKGGISVNLQPQKAEKRMALQAERRKLYVVLAGKEVWYVGEAHCSMQVRECNVALLPTGT